MASVQMIVNYALVFVNEIQNKSFFALSKKIIIIITQLEYYFILYQKSYRDTMAYFVFSCTVIF